MKSSADRNKTLKKRRGDVPKASTHCGHGTTLRIRNAVDIFFLFVFAALIAAGKIQLWFALFAVGVLVSTVAGRFYCGWICPMHTLKRPVEYLYKKLEKARKRRPKNPGPKYGRRTAPPLFNGPAARYIALVLFIAAVVSQKAFGFKVPVLPILTGIAVLRSLFFEERWWHSVLCPFGTILESSSRKARFGFSVDQERCTGCGSCERVCPAGAIYKLSEERTAVREVDTSKCLLCYSCAETCPFDAIGYGKIK